jgi:NifU-like protein involved in Fe-S cluster formation
MTVPVYSQEVLRRFDAPDGAGPLFGGGTVVRGTAGDFSRGTRVEFHLRLDNGAISACRFQAYGCPHVIAAASWIAERAEGLEIGEPPAAFSAMRVAEALEAPAEKLGPLLVVEDAFAAALAAGRERLR